MIRISLLHLFLNITDFIFTITGTWVQAMQKINYRTLRMHAHICLYMHIFIQYMKTNAIMAKATKENCLHNLLSKIKHRAETWGSKAHSNKTEVVTQWWMEQTKQGSTVCAAASLLVVSHDQQPQSITSCRLTVK